MPRDGATGPTEVDQLGREGLKAAWEEAFGSPPPPYLSVGFMRKALAYDRQCRAQGGLPASLRKRLAAVARGDARGAAAAPAVGAGAHLVREWNGRTYRVEVLADGYRMDGRSYCSLSAVARRITGTAWSGPRFFGLCRSQGRRLMQKVRCAIYTRKSSEDGLEQEFNSLHAQREACAAYVKSQKAEGWVLLPDALRRRRALRRDSGAPGAAAAARRPSMKGWSIASSSTRSTG